MRPTRLAVVLAVLAAPACTDSATEPEEDPIRPPPADAAAINAFVTALPDWPSSVPAQRAPVARAPLILREAYPGNDIIEYQCGVSGKNLVRTFPKLLAAGSDFSRIYPGALVEGASVRSGTPVTLAIGRSPITVRINLPLQRQSIRVTDVNSTNVLQAIADLQRAAATEQGTRDVIPADMVFELAEATTLDQSMTAIGVAAGYEDPMKGIGASGNIDTRMTRSAKTNSVVVKFVQEMFTVRVADDELPEAADFFAPGVRVADLQALQAAGKISPANLPLYVESVTYGRAMLFTLRSTDVENVEELRVAMQASGRGFNGSASLTTRQRQLLTSATYQFVIFGGPQSAATAAIASLDWSKYFVPAAATTAVPIAFTVRSLKGRETATIYNDIVYDERGGCKLPSSYTVEVTLTRVERSSGFCLACSFSAEIRYPGAILPVVMRAGVFGPATGPMTFSDKRTVSLAPTQSFNLCSFFDTGSFCMPFGYPGAVSGNTNNMKSLTSGVTATLSPTANAPGAAGKFTYSVKKTAHFN
jgi:hypothetical protein